MIKHLSPSSCRTWDAECKRLWWAKYVEERKNPAGPAAEIGFNFGIEVVRRIGCPVNPDAPDAAIKFGPKALPVMDPDGLVKSLVDTYFRKKWAWTTADMAEAPAHMSVEYMDRLAQSYGLPRPKSLFVPFVGYIDLLRSMNGISKAVVDLKTSKSKGFRPEWMFQVVLYCAAEQADHAEIHLLTRTKTPVAYRHKVPITRDTLRWAMQRLIAGYDQIEAALAKGEVPHETPGYWCDWCPILDCPVKYASDQANVAEE